MSAPDPSKLLVAGDVHANIAWMRALCDLALTHEAYPAVGVKTGEAVCVAG